VPPSAVTAIDEMVPPTAETAILTLLLPVNVVLFAGELTNRLGLSCDFELRAQTDFSEPHVRINTDRFGEETTSWDELAAYYKQLMVKRS
jgi:hypothetical protein